MSVFWRIFGCDEYFVGQSDDLIIEFSSAAGRIEITLALLAFSGSCVELGDRIDSFNGQDQGFLQTGEPPALLQLIVPSSDGYNPVALHC